MRSGKATIRTLREQLVQARRRRDLSLLRQVENGLVHLGNRRYRCCLVDYASCRPHLYVRLLGYANARVKAQIEFPIAPDLEPVQWLPLSHLADYGEVDAPGHIARIYAQVGDYIHHREARLEPRRRALPPRRRGGRRRRCRPAGAPSLWWYAGSAFLAALVLGGLIALRLGNGYY